jgi:23S rRNA (guanosine2251-2'-O)-methyltransferase
MIKKTMSDLERASVQDFKAAVKRPIVLVLDNVRSMHNVGSVFRTADAFLAEQIILCGYTPRPPHRDIHKTALGATETVNWSYAEQALETIQDLKHKGYAIWAVEQVHGSVNLNQFIYNRNQPIALIFGNEAEGVQQEILPFVDGCIEIPQDGTKHSLNISVAVGVVLWEICRNPNP